MKTSPRLILLLASLLAFLLAVRRPVKLFASQVGRIRGFLLATLVMLLFTSTATRADTIAEVLEHSQASRLASLPDADATGSGALSMQGSFNRLQRVSRLRVPVELHVVDVGAVAEALDGRVIVVNSALGELPEICRLFLLAHELGHVQMRHWTERVQLYERYIPGEVRQEQTDAVASALSVEASQLAYRQEFDADAYAMRTLLDMGYTQDELLSMFVKLGSHASTATHPSTARRVAHLRMIDGERRMASSNVEMTNVSTGP